MGVPCAHAQEHIWLAPGQVSCSPELAVATWGNVLGWVLGLLMPFQVFSEMLNLKVSCELNQVWPQCQYLLKNGYLESCWFYCSSLLFPPENSCKAEQNWYALTNLCSKWGFVIHNCCSRRGCGKENLFALIPWLPGRREAFMHQLMKSNKTQNLPDTPSNEQFIPLALITVWLRSESIFTAFFYSHI